MKPRTSIGTEASTIRFIIDRTSAVPIADQLSRFLRNEILSGLLPSGAKLPTTRDLSAQLGCSRGTIQIALETLYAEGFLQAKTKAGIRICDRPVATPAANEVEGDPSAVAMNPEISQLAIDLVARPMDSLERASNFSPSFPEVRDFPWPTWSRMHREVWSNPKIEMLRNRDPMGLEALRSVLADYLRVTRGLNCTSDQVMITAGASHAIDLLGRFLIDPGDEIWCENPGFLEGQNLLSNVGGTLVPISIDGEGIVVKEGCRLAPKARLAIVSPAHHFPMGSILSLHRRLELVEWARLSKAWIIEDDYDSEFHSSLPISAVQAFAPDRVFLVGTFSKTIFPSLRLGYIVCPPGSEQLLAQFRLRLDGHTSIASQAVVAEFIRSGHFSLHIRRMRKLYAKRRDAFLAQCKLKLSDWFEVQPRSEGMHVVLTLKQVGITDCQISDALTKSGIYAPRLSSYFHADPVQGLVLGFASMTEREGAARVDLIRACMVRSGAVR